MKLQKNRFAYNSWTQFSVKELSEIPPLINKTKASDAKTKVCNGDCICMSEINTSDGKLDISTSESKLSAEISQNVLEMDTLKAKQKDLEVKNLIHQQCSPRNSGRHSALPT